jgi:hypothetical protein
MAVIDVVCYAEECRDGLALAGRLRVPVMEWFDGIPSLARIRLIARLELLEMRGSTFKGPHILRLSDRVRALWCRCEGARHLILYAVSEGPSTDDRQTAVLIHGLSVAEPLSLVAGGGDSKRGLSRASSGRAAPQPAPQSAIAPARIPATWAGLIPTEQVVLARERLERYEASPSRHGFVPEFS